MTRFENPASAKFLRMFDIVWNDEEKLKDVADEVINMVSAVYQKNYPKPIYFMTLCNIFVLPN